MGDNRLKKIIIGEKMPDKDDPKYRDKYENDVEAGKKFARMTRIDRLAGHIQRFAEKHRDFFLATVFGIILFCFVLNVLRISRAYKTRQHSPGAVITQEEVLRDRLLEDSQTMIPIPQEDGTDKED